MSHKPPQHRPFDQEDADLHGPFHKAVFADVAARNPLNLAITGFTIVLKLAGRWQRNVRIASCGGEPGTLHTHLVSLADGGLPALSFG